MAFMEGVSRGVHLEVIVERGMLRVKVVRWRGFVEGAGGGLVAASDELGEACSAAVAGEGRDLEGFLGCVFRGLAAADSAGDSVCSDARGRPRPCFGAGSACVGLAWFCAFETANSASDGRPRLGFAGPAGALLALFAPDAFPALGSLALAASLFAPASEGA